MRKNKSNRRANDEWIKRQSYSDDARRLYEQERLIVSVLEELSKRMTQEDLSKADIARRLNVSRAYVTKVLSGGQNATLRTLADFFWACNFRAQIRSQPLRDGRYISSPVNIVRQTQVIDTSTNDNTNSFEDVSQHTLAG